jgi:Ca2+-binding EF-hand superfamily protein
MPEPQPVPVIEAAKNTLDVNKDGKVDMADVKAVAKKTRARVKKAADLDGDGRVTVKDVKVAATRARKTANAVADKAVQAATKSRAKKPTSSR